MYISAYRWRSLHIEVRGYKSAAAFICKVAAEGTGSKGFLVRAGIARSTTHVAVLSQEEEEQQEEEAVAFSHAD